MKDPKQAVAESAKDSSRQEMIDERVIAEADDDSASEAAIEVKRNMAVLRAVAAKHLNRRSRSR